MTTVQFELPDQLAEEAQRPGLLPAERMEATLREQLRMARIAQLVQARGKLAGDSLPAMTAEEIRAEIEAYRREQRPATGS